MARLAPHFSVGAGAAPKERPSRQPAADPLATLHARLDNASMTQDPTAVARLLDIMAKLRHPTEGCPWDIEQDFATIAPYTIEEAYEVAEAIDAGDMVALKDELGDLFFQVVFHAQLAQEAQHFSFADVVAAVCDKMERRHPHVFGDTVIESATDQIRHWEALKADERRAHAEETPEAPSQLDRVPLALPALTRAVKLQQRAARVGFDWSHAAQVLDKVAEEINELRGALAEGGDAAVAEELGDLLFACVNLARHVGIDAETALRAANAKFERRFRHVELGLAAHGRSPEDASLAEMERLWDEAKAEEGG